MIDVYYLTPEGGKPVHVLDNPYGASRVVTVRGGDYTRAKAKALEHAQDKCLIVVAHCQPMRCAAQGVPRPHSTYDDHGLLLYLERILNDYAGAVVLPHVSELPFMVRGWEYNVPRAPMMAAYSAQAVRGLPVPLEYNLVKKGYRVVTTGDYAYDQYGPTVLHPYGTKEQWNHAHEKTLEILF